MNRAEFEAWVWRHSAALAGPAADRAMDAILAAADAYARSWQWAGPDEADVTAQRRELLGRAVAKPRGVA